MDKTPWQEYIDLTNDALYPTKLWGIPINAGNHTQEETAHDEEPSPHGYAELLAKINQSNCLVVAAAAGAGKTYAAQVLGERALDLECVPFKYDLKDKPKPACGEAAKASYGAGMLHIQWPANYVAAICWAVTSGEYDVVFIAPDQFVLGGMGAIQMPFVLAYPTRNQMEDYLQRYKARGNSELFIDIFIGGWDGFIGMYERCPYEHTALVLQPGEYLLEGLRRVRPLRCKNL